MDLGGDHRKPHECARSLFGQEKHPGQKPGETPNANSQCRQPVPTERQVKVTFPPTFLTGARILQ